MTLACAYQVLYHEPPPGAAEAEREAAEAPAVVDSEPTMQEGIQLPELLAKIKALREAGLRAEHVAFSFMKRRVQPLMARDTLGYQDIVDRVGRIFKDMPAYTPCPVPEYSAARPPNEVSSRTHCPVLITEE
jgi:hypothetical protein